MKYALIESDQDWVVIKDVIYKSRTPIIGREYKGIIRGYIVAISKNKSQQIGNRYECWINKFKYISESTANDIIQSGYVRRNKLSVDFDLTLASDPKDVWPDVGKQKLVNKIVAMYVRHMHNKGWTIILNTMREPGKGLEQAKQFCIDNDIPIDYYNDNVPEDTKKFGYSRKIGCTRSIDDTQVGLIGWMLRTFS